MSCINEDFQALKFTTGDRKTLAYQLRNPDQNPADITGNTFKWAAKGTAEDVVFKIDPVNAVLTDPVNGFFTFTLDMPADPFTGIYELVQIDGGGNQNTLTPAEGVAIQVIEGLIP